MKRTIVHARRLLAAAAGLAALATLSSGPWGCARNAPPRPASLAAAIDGASDYLVRHCDGRGKFVYRVNLDPKVDVPPKYNIIRHAGVIYALAISHRRAPSAEKLDAMRRGVAFLRREGVGPVPGHDDMLAVWSRPGEEYPQEGLQAKLGGTGLGLVALLSLEQIEPGTIPLEELRKLGRFLVFMQNDDGSFCGKFHPDSRGRDDTWRSLYYPGEAALGLVMLYERDPDPVWLERAARGIAYLARTRRRAQVVEADHWALLATARLWPVCERCRPPLPHAMLADHAAQICRQILDAPRPGPDDKTSWAGCLTADGRTCPTATRVEGLTATLSFLPQDDSPLRAEMERATSEAVDFLIRSQVREGEYAGGIPRAVAPGEGAAESAGESPDGPRATEVRMDYVQHALCAMIQWERIRAERSEPQPSGS